MRIKYLSPLSDLEDELKPLFSNEHILAFFKKFCDIIKSQMWGWKKGKKRQKWTLQDNQDALIDLFLEA